MHALQIIHGDQVAACERTQSAPTQVLVVGDAGRIGDIAGGVFEGTAGNIAAELLALGGVGRDRD